MAIKNQKITDRYALYNGDCIEVMKDMPDNSIDLSVYSPPFAGLYHYSSSDRDLSNADSYEQFFEHYSYVVKDIHRLTKPGRCTAVHAAPIPRGNSGKDCLYDFPGEVLRLHESLGFEWIATHYIWKEPLTVRNRTMQKNLAHKTVVDDSVYCGVAVADHLMIFRKKGLNENPVSHDRGLKYYAGEREMPIELLRYKNYKGKQTENRFSHWIWRQYASCFWDDIRLDNVLPYKACRDKEDEKHVHPLQLDVINRIIELRSNVGDTVFTPFMGVGSEVYGALINNRRGIGVELKEAYFNQAVKHIEGINYNEMKETTLFDTLE